MLTRFRIQRGNKSSFESAGLPQKMQGFMVPNLARINCNRRSASKIPGATGIRVQLRPKLMILEGIIGGGKPVKPTASTGFMERAMGIEPTSEAWGAFIVPLGRRTLQSPELSRREFHAATSIRKSIGCNVRFRPRNRTGYTEAKFRILPLGTVKQLRLAIEFFRKQQ